VWTGNFPHVEIPARFLAQPILVFEDEFLNPIIVMVFTNIKVSVRVHGHVLYEIELPRIRAPMSKLAHDSAVVALENPNHTISSVSDQEIFLLGIV